MSRREQLTIQEKDRQISDLRKRVEDLDEASRAINKSVDAILYSVIQKYGGKRQKISIPVPDVASAPKIEAFKQKKDEVTTYVIRVAKEKKKE